MIDLSKYEGIAPDDLLAALRRETQQDFADERRHQRGLTAAFQQR